MARTVQKETEVQSAICEYLTARRIFFVRLNNIPAFFIDKAGGKQFRRLGKYARVGLPDILAIKDGRPTFLEVKSATGKPTPEQISFGADAIVAGAGYFIVRSIDDVREKAGL